jgi:hypothetical protein
MRRLHGTRTSRRALGVTVLAVAVSSVAGVGLASSSNNGSSTSQPGVRTAKTVKITTCNGNDNVLFTIGAAQIAAQCGYPFTSDTGQVGTLAKVTVTNVATADIAVSFGVGAGVEASTAQGNRILHPGDQDAAFVCALGGDGSGAVACSNMIVVFQNGKPSFSGTVGAWIESADGGPVIATAQMAG